MAYTYDKDKIKSQITIEQVRQLVADLGGDPSPIVGNSFTAETICHNHPGEGSHKLYFYDNGEQGLFKCYTNCEGYMDVFQLVSKVMTLKESKEYSLPAAVQFVAGYFGFAPVLEKNEETHIQPFLRSLQKYDKIKEKEIKKETSSSELKEYDGNFLNHLPSVSIKNWLDEGISASTMRDYEISYEPKEQVIVIPHRDINGRLVGIRQRTLIKEDAELYGKYRPLRINGQMYNSALGFNLYGLYKTKRNIVKSHRVILFESEKSVLKMDSFFGPETNFSAAVCGSSITQHQINLLHSLEVTHITVAFDRCGSEDKEEIKKYVKKFYDFHYKYGREYHIDFIYDKDGEYLGLKDSPIDKGKEVFLKLYNNRRINLYD